MMSNNPTRGLSAHKLLHIMCFNLVTIAPRPDTGLKLCCITTRPVIGSWPGSKEEEEEADQERGRRGGGGEGGS